MKLVCAVQVTVVPSHFFPLLLNSFSLGWCLVAVTALNKLIQKPWGWNIHSLDWTEYDHNCWVELFILMSNDVVPTPGYDDVAHVGPRLVRCPNQSTGPMDGASLLRVEPFSSLNLLLWHQSYHGQVPGPVIIGSGDWFETIVIRNNWPFSGDDVFWRDHLELLGVCSHDLVTAIHGTTVTIIIIIINILLIMHAYQAINNMQYQHRHV